MINKMDIEKHLTTDFVGRNIECHESIESTNIRAKEVAMLADEGTVIIAEEQTMGRGRLGRSWMSPKSKGLWFSIILKPYLDPGKISKITLIGAAAVHKALKELGITSHIKWPNDVVVEGKKVCGILTEMVLQDENSYYVIMGIGINANLDKGDFHDELKDKATSLKIIKGAEIDRSRLLACVLNNFEKLYIPFKEKEDISETIKISRENSILLNREVRIIKDNVERTGRTIDLDQEGRLIVEFENGKIEAILSGEVSVRGMEGYVDN